MKNATQQHERRIKVFLSNLGCTSIQLKNEGLVALRPGRDGRLYPLSIDLYEEEGQPSGSDLRFRARAARRFGLPVSYHHGESIEDALGAIQWANLDRPLVPRVPLPLSRPLLAGM
jgi:hypothetical protein